MGAASSSFSELPTNDYLKKLAGTEPLSSIDPFWNQLLSFSFLSPISRFIPDTDPQIADARLLEESTSSICKNLALNNCRTGNFGALVRNFLVRATELKASTQCDDNIFTWQTYNALFIIRSLCKYFVENLSEELILQQFDATNEPEGETEGSGSLTEELMNSLAELLVDVPVVSFTYALHLEALNTLLVLLSIQMYQPQAASNFFHYRCIMQGKCSIHACLLMKALLRNYINQEKCPAELFKASNNSSGMLYNITSSVASGIWNVVTLGMGGGAKKKEEECFNEALLSNQSILFILVLANHCTGERSLNNPYRQALYSFTNSQDESSNSNPTQAIATFKLDFSKLYDTLCITLKDDQTTLLLYLLLHRNAYMKAFILSRTNIDSLVMPILQILYHAQDRNSHHIYMALIILLILSEDDLFNKAIHDIVIKTVAWFKERTINEITLGGLLILVVIRTIQYNMTRMRDKYLHTNCLAALANMSSHFNNLHPYVAQRIVSLFAQLCKKHTRLIEQIRVAAIDGPQETLQENGIKALESDIDQDYVQDLAVLEEVIRMVLEIINSCLCSNILHNPNLVYSLLYQKELFTMFRTHPTFQDIIQNIDTVLSYFSSRLELNGQNLSPSEVLTTIKEGAVQFRKDRLKKFPELRFKYVEEESPEEFFIPYIWSLVFHSSHMYFNPARIMLFSLAVS
ncbi:DYM [Acanthosepion pharaonis]|uniref:Dymeclin n=1 Tax=Acanthosepion pharaonis TaxID=158019 RepID=A0A812E5M2_ACAPH|nr:DYM [Sepia pharaonis]